MMGGSITFNSHEDVVVSRIVGHEIIGKLVLTSIDEMFEEQG